MIGVCVERGRGREASCLPSVGRQIGREEEVHV